jgi:hypothetical protein
VSIQVKPVVENKAARVEWSLEWLGLSSCSMVEANR